MLGNTFFFVLGVSFAFFLLGLGFTAAGRFFSRYQSLFTRAGGILVVLFGLYQLGILGQSRLIASEHRLPFRLDRFTMGPLAALLLGFTFSFAWTPCVGPALASVLLLASSAASAARGFALIGLYTLGFTLPFLAAGLFTGTLLDFFKQHQKVVRYTVKAGGVLMVLMGVMMFTGWMNGVSSYLSRFGAARDASGRREPILSRRHGLPHAFALRPSGIHGLPGPGSGPRLYPVRPERRGAHPVRLPGQDRLSQFLGHLVPTLQGGDARHPGPL